MKQRKKAIFFDFGGTLMDYESDRKAHTEMMKEFRARYNVKESVEELTTALNQFIGTLNRNPLCTKLILGRDIIRRSFEHVMEYLGLGSSEEENLWFHQVYLEKHHTYLRLYPDAKSVLRTLWGKGIHIGLISDIDHDFMIDELTRLGIIEYFDSLTSSEEAGVWKPDPHIFQLALSKAQCTGAESIHIGDNLERDINGAKHMGMTAIWFPNSPDASSDIPDYTIQNIREILEMVSEFGIPPH
jgi:HAD superfamily hydrolase (TIGR01549 family)